MTHGIGALPKFIPSPPISSFHVGPLDIHFYALGYIIGITMAILITRRRWRALGGDPDMVGDIALWVVPAGIIGGRIYFDITTPGDIPHVWYGVFAVWTGGLGSGAVSPSPRRSVPGGCISSASPSDRLPTPSRPRYSSPSAEAVLTLRAVISNGDFEEYWSYHLAR